MLADGGACFGVSSMLFEVLLILLFAPFLILRTKQWFRFSVVRFAFSARVARHTDDALTAIFFRADTS